jgi:hypothetical protein
LYFGWIYIFSLALSVIIFVVLAYSLHIDQQFQNEYVPTEVLLFCGLVLSLPILGGAIGALDGKLKPRRVFLVPPLIILIIFVLGFLYGLVMLVHNVSNPYSISAGGDSLDEIVAKILVYPLIAMVGWVAVDYLIYCLRKRV